LRANNAIEWSQQRTGIADVMVIFSCDLKLGTPLSTITAIFPN